MKILLVSPYATIAAVGLRCVAARLKKDGHAVTLAFLPRRFTRRYTDGELDQLAALAAGARLAGVSLMTNHFDNAAALTARLRRAGCAVAWGGIHPTVRPEECLEHADMVCIGEGEETFAELAGKMEAGGDWRATPGMWFRDGGAVIKNPLRPPVQDLDALPFQDFGPEGHYILHGGRLQPLTGDLLRLYLKGDYLTLPSRGCPFNCTYCCNHALNALYGGSAPVRKRSPASVLAELRQAKAKLPFLDHVTFEDDSFFSYTEAELGELAAGYRADIGLPLEVRGAHPAMMDRAKLRLMADAGLTGIQVGIQSASARVNALYGRTTAPERMAAAAALLNEFRDRIPLPRYTVILENPWETPEESAETLMFVARLPRPFTLNLFSLTLYPGTALSDRALKEGLIRDERREVYNKTYNLAPDGTAARLRKTAHINSLFYLLSLCVSYGIPLTPEALAAMAAGGGRTLRGRLLYFWYRQRAALALRLDLLRRAARAAAEGRELRDDYSLD